MKKSRIALAAVAATCALAAVGLHVFGPRFNIWLVPPSPQRYGEHVLSLLDAGLYAHGDTWAQARAEAAAAAASAHSHEEVDAIMKDAVKVAGGHHSFIATADQLGQAAEENNELPSISQEDGVLILSLPSFTGDAEQGGAYANTLADAITTGDHCGVVVDLTANNGGDMGPMIAGLSPLLPDGTVTTFVVGDDRSPVTLAEGRVEGGGTPTQVSATTSVDLPVALLVGEQTASSAEQVLLAFHGLDNAASFGQPTAGYASVNQTIPLYTGAMLGLTIGVTEDRTGQRFSDQPIDPTYAVPAEEAKSAAISWLREKGCA